MRGIDNSWEIPIPLYYHSKIDKNQEGIFLLIKLTAICITNNI